MGACYRILELRLPQLGLDGRAILLYKEDMQPPREPGPQLGGFSLAIH